MRGSDGVRRLIVAIGLAALCGCSAESDEAEPSDGVDPAGLVEPSEPPMRVPSATVDGDDRVSLRAEAVSSEAVVLRWQRPIGDDSDGYEILRDSVPVGLSRTGRFLDEPVPPGDHRYAVRARQVDAIAGIDVTGEAVFVEVRVPTARERAVQAGGVEPRLGDANGLIVTIDPADRLAASGYAGDRFAVQLAGTDGAAQATRVLDGLEAAGLLIGAQRWYVLADRGAQRPIIALDPSTLATAWTLESTTLALSGGCRFARVLGDGALSCRGFVDDSVRIDIDGAVGPVVPGVRLPTGVRLSADAGSRRVDVWTLPAETLPSAFFAHHEWVTRNARTGTAVDRGALLDDDPRIDFAHTIDALGLVDGGIVVAGDVLANGCLRVCVQELAIPPYVDGHYVARIDPSTGRAEAVRRLPLGERLGRGSARADGDGLVFLTTDRVSWLDPATLQVRAVLPVGGEPLGPGATSVLTRVPGTPDRPPGLFLFAR